MRIDEKTYKAMPIELQALFHKCPNPGSEEVVGMFPAAARFFYCAKASKRDRDEGCEGMDERKVSTMNSYTSPSEGRTADKNGGPKRNHHPTVKPTDLMRYLCRLITPPGGIVVDPFMGSGSTGKACAREGFLFVGMEVERMSFDLAQARVTAAFVEGEQFRPESVLLETEE